MCYNKNSKEQRGDGMKRILIIEDDRDILDIVAFNLEQEGYEVVVAADGEEGLLAFAGGNFDLVILDIMMPKMDGLQVLDTIRTRADLPVLIMSAKTSEEDRLKGFARQADDYICKPFSVKELVMRVKVHLARSEKGEGPRGRIPWGEYELDEQNKTVFKEGQPVSFSKKEFQLMLLFAQNRERVYSREELMRAVWGYSQVHPEDRTVDVAIRRLREKMEEDPSDPRYIISKRGLGYQAGDGR